MDNYIKGIYTRSIFKSNDGFVIGLIKVKEVGIEKFEDYVNRTITFTGHFHELNEQDPYIFYGEEIVHPKYGTQFKVDKYDPVKPEGKDGLIEFLSSDLFPGVGEKTATAIVEALGENVIDKIINDEEILNTVSSISKKQKETVYINLQKHEESHRTIVTLCDMGFSMRDALNIYNEYGSNTIRQIEHNIYVIIDDIKNISFAKIDQVARNFDIEPTNENRVKSAILYLMGAICFKTGDTYIEYDVIKNEVERFLNISINNDIFIQYLDDLQSELKIINDNEKYYLIDLYEAEENIINTVKYLNEKLSDRYSTIDEVIERVESANNIEYNDLQKKAIKESLINNISIITGGPGTGKTTIIKAIVEVYRRINRLDPEDLIEEIALLAPTGRASKRISESTEIPAMTIHRFLKWNKETDEFGINENNKDYSKLIIIDEFSMVDIVLLDNLFKGLTNGIKVILVGDYHQLPSVSPGQILKDFVLSKKLPTVHLDLLYRQSDDSYIPILAGEIKEGSVNDSTFLSHSDYQYIECQSPSILENIIKVVNDLNEQNIDYSQYQIMAPMYRGLNGIDNLNLKLQEVLNPKDKSKNQIKYGDTIYRVNDKVIQLVNIPEENVYNGDIGIIINITDAKYSESKKIEIYVDYDGDVVKYYPQSFNQLKHAFVISIHKAQGSEFETVIIPVCLSYQRMLYRKLIYTGVTRAKKKLYIIGDHYAYGHSIVNNNEYERKGDLFNKIMNNI